MMIDMATMTRELIRDEGARACVYDDATGLPIRPGSHVAGHPTIGVGRALDVAGLRDAEVAYLLSQDIAAYLAELQPWRWFAAMDPARQRAVVNMRHQLGLAGLLGFTHMIAAITQGDWHRAAVEARCSKWAIECPERAARVLALLEHGDQATPTGPAGTVA